jgi:hypothetical protein
VRKIERGYADLERFLESSLRDYADLPLQAGAITVCLACSGLTPLEWYGDDGSSSFMDDSTSSDGETGVSENSGGAAVLVTSDDEWVEGGVTEVSAGSVVAEPYRQFQEVGRGGSLWWRFRRAREVWIRGLELRARDTMVSRG